MTERNIQINFACELLIRIYDTILSRIILTSAVMVYEMFSSMLMLLLCAPC